MKFENGLIDAIYTNIIASDHYTSQTGTLTKGSGTNVNGRNIVKAGTVYPKNDATAIGIVLYDVDVTDSDATCAYMDHGGVYENRLPVALDTAAKTALAGKIFFRKYEA